MRSFYLFTDFYQHIISFIKEYHLNLHSHVQTLSCHSLSCVRHLPLSSGSRSVLDNLQCGLRPTLLRIDNRIYRTETHFRHCVWHHHLHGTEKPPQTHSFEKVTKLTRKSNQAQHPAMSSKYVGVLL